MIRPRRPPTRLLALLVAALAVAPGFAQAPAAGEPARFPWLDPATTRPIVLRLEHSILYDREAGRIRVERSKWDLDWLRLDLFGGRMTFAGRGLVRADAAEDVATTITLRQVQIEEVMRFLLLPRAGEIRAELTGSIYFHIEKGDWAEIDVSVRGAPGTVSISRALLHDLLASPYGGSLKPLDVDLALDQYYAGRAMIPFSGVQVEGRLTRELLVLSMPLRNQAISVGLDEIRIDRGLLWQLWERFKKIGLEDVGSIDVETTGGVQAPQALPGSR